MTVDFEQPGCAFVIELNEERAGYVTDALTEYNRTRSSSLWSRFPQASAPLEIYALDEQGVVAGGLLGVTNEIPEWLNVGVVWVAQERRRHGIGRRLMSMAEEEAKRRSCRYARLATGDYQAPDFYKKLGYQIYGKLENCPQGETTYYFSKQLT